MVTELEQGKEPGQRTRGWLKRLRRSEAGQTLVEFSLVLPVLLVMLFAIVDFGRAMYTWSIVSNAAREGGRTAAVQGTTAQINTAVNSAATGLNLGSLTKTYTNVQGTKGTTVTVNVSYAFTYVTPISPLLTLIGGSSLSNPTISSSSSMRLE